MFSSFQHSLFFIQRNSFDKTFFNFLQGTSICASRKKQNTLQQTCFICWCADLLIVFLSTARILVRHEHVSVVKQGRFCSTCVPCTDRPNRPGRGTSVWKSFTNSAWDLFNYCHRMEKHYWRLVFVFYGYPSPARPPGDINARAVL